MARARLFLGRVLHADADFVTLEVAKRDDTVFHFQQNEEGETVGGDEFFTFVFVRAAEGSLTQVEPWDPFT